MTDPTPPAVDGRTAIRDRNREAVIDAVLALFAEGDVSPTPEAAAARAGLSVRSVYRYFEDRDALVRAAIARRLETVVPIFDDSVQRDGPLDERVARLVAGRLSLYDATVATQRVGRIRAVYDPIVADQMEIGRRALRDQVEGQFQPELDALSPDRRRARLDACDALLQLTSIDLLVARVGRSTTQVASELADAVTALLRP